uniref:Putative secreted protein n=1 Tax=Anopheles marajoara TaxID=58244 RepID=A0A2M4C887_9DIPT
MERSGGSPVWPMLPLLLLHHHHHHPALPSTASSSTASSSTGVDTVEAASSTNTFLFSKHPSCSHSHRKTIHPVRVPYRSQKLPSKHRNPVVRRSSSVLTLSPPSQHERSKGNL